MLSFTTKSYHLETKKVLSADLFLCYFSVYSLFFCVDLFMTKPISVTIIILMYYYNHWSHINNYLCYNNHDYIKLHNTNLITFEIIDYFNRIEDVYRKYMQNFHVIVSVLSAI